MDSGAVVCTFSAWDAPEVSVVEPGASVENVWPSEVVSVEAAVLPGPVTSVFLVVSMTPLVAAVASVAARALVTDPAIIMPAISSANPAFVCLRMVKKPPENNKYTIHC